MPRWDPGTQERLTTAALDLFLARGYDAVTVADIAERAGTTRRTFFRYFTDKREVLFAGSEQLPPAVTDAVLAADPALAPLPAALHAAREIGALLVARVERPAARRTVIESSDELRERERTKLASLTGALHDALLRRDAPPERAGPAAQLAALMLTEAFRRWVGDGGDREFGPCLDEVVDAYRVALDDLG